MSLIFRLRISGAGAVGLIVPSRRLLTGRALTARPAEVHRTGATRTGSRGVSAVSPQAELRKEQRNNQPQRHALAY
jgi:hypothetical protein